METYITLNITATDKASYRNQIIREFIKEQPGTTTSVTVYYYFVETLAGGKRIYLKRPTSLNKGVDFEVRVEDTFFRYGKHGNILSTGNRPSHNDIAHDLIQKKGENPTEFTRLKTLLDKIYYCQLIDNAEYTTFSFTSGHSVEIIFKSLKWLFIEQDVTYWNRSGRAMLYESLSQIWLDVN